MPRIFLKSPDSKALMIMTTGRSSLFHRMNLNKLASIKYPRSSEIGESYKCVNKIKSFSGTHSLEAQFTPTPIPIKNPGIKKLLTSIL